MNIAFLAHDRKKDLMVQLCFAYKSILEKHTLCATNTTGKLISEATGMPVTLYLHANQGGAQQIGARISYNEIDLVLFFEPLFRLRGGNVLRFGNFRAAHQNAVPIHERAHEIDKPTHKGSARCFAAFVGRR